MRFYLYSFFRNLERDLLLVATKFIEKDKNVHVRKSSKDVKAKVVLLLVCMCCYRVAYVVFSVSPLQSRYSDVDISAYGHQNVDRFGVLVDIWSNEAIYLENKRQVCRYLKKVHHEKLIRFLCWVALSVLNCSSYRGPVRIISY
jgi:hypothetical protein